MRHASPSTVLLAAFAAGLFFLSLSVFTVDQREQALVLQLGDPVGGVMKPGLHFKIPFIQDVRRFDARILSVDPDDQQDEMQNAIIIHSSHNSNAAAQPEAGQKQSGNATAASQGATDSDSGEPLVVETLARYRIDNPLKFMQTLGTTEAAAQRIKSIMNDTKRSVLGVATMRQLLSPERAELMEKIKKLTNDKTVADQLGITIIDIRIVAVEQPASLRKNTVDRMISAFQWQAMQTSSNGYKRALEIKSNADRQKTIILANAQRDARAIEGDGDRQAIKIYADAFGRDKDFYEFWRSMEAYRTALGRDGARFVLTPDDPFLKYFRQMPQDK